MVPIPKSILRLSQPNYKIDISPNRKFTTRPIFQAGKRHHTMSTEKTFSESSEVQAQSTFRLVTLDDIQAILELMNQAITLQELLDELSSPDRVAACSTITPIKEFLLFENHISRFYIIKHVGKNYKIIAWLMNILINSSRTYIVYDVPETDRDMMQNLTELGFRATSVKSRENDVDVFIFEYHKK